MFAHAGRGNMTKMAHTYIHTYMDQCRFKKGRFFHVCFILPMQAEEITLQERFQKFQEISENGSITLRTTPYSLRS